MLYHVVYTQTFRKVIKDPVYKKCAHLCKFIVHSAIATLAASLSQHQNGQKL